LDRASEFYENTLGLSRGEKSSDGVSFLCEDGSRILVFFRPGGASADNTAVSWEVDDLEDAMKRLRDRGVVFDTYENEDLEYDATR
jgi:catechol 2,3-dioxygenase-like lactoylglutathione lyase family enzyme